MYFSPFDSYFPIPSARICGNSAQLLISWSMGEDSLTETCFDCMGLYEMLHRFARAAFAAAVLASRFEGPKENSD